MFIKLTKAGSEIVVRLAVDKIAYYELSNHPPYTGSFIAFESGAYDMHVTESVEEIDNLIKNSVTYLSKALFFKKHSTK